MHARELIDFAALIAGEGEILRGSVRQIPSSAIVQYWLASRCRLNRWAQALNDFRDAPVSTNPSRRRAWQRVRPVCEEILASEMLTRVWSAIVASLKSPAVADEAQPVAAAAMAGHVDVSNRVMNLLSTCPHVVPEAASELNRLRRVIQRWTDLILGRLGPTFSIDSVAHDAGRTREFAEDFAQPCSAVARRQSWSLLQASLRAAFGRRLHGSTENADLNSQIAGAIVACFPEPLFDSAGAYHSLWLLRLSAVSTDVQTLIDDLLTADAPQPALRTQQRRLP